MSAVVPPSSAALFITSGKLCFTSWFTAWFLSDASQLWCIGGNGPKKCEWHVAALSTGILLPSECHRIPFFFGEKEIALARLHLRCFYIYLCLKRQCSATLTPRHSPQRYRIAALNHLRVAMMKLSILTLVSTAWHQTDKHVTVHSEMQTPTDLHLLSREYSPPPSHCCPGVVASRQRIWDEMDSLLSLQWEEKTRSDAIEC